jgi:hypothetical protein
VVKRVMRQQKLQPHSKTDEFSMQPHALNNFFIQAARTPPIKRRRFAAGFCTDCTGPLQPMMLCVDSGDVCMLMSAPAAAAKRARSLPATLATVVS